MIFFDRAPLFEDREDAAYELAGELMEYSNTNGVILAIPRGGVPVGYVLSRELGLPLDISLSKKIGHPENPEYAIGSVSLQGVILNSNNVPMEYIVEETKKVRDLLTKRYALYMGNRRPQSLSGKTVIIVDDGVATGSTVLATIAAVRENSPKEIVVAVPVASPEALEAIEEQADRTVCLEAPEHFSAVGQFYRNFAQLDDDEVIYLLHDAAREFSDRA